MRYNLLKWRVTSCESGHQILAILMNPAILMNLDHQTCHGRDNKPRLPKGALAEKLLSLASGQILKMNVT